MLVIKISNNDKLKQTKIKYFFNQKTSLREFKKRQNERKTFITYESERWFIFRYTKKNGQKTWHQKQGGRHIQTAKKSRERCSDFSFWNGGNVMWCRTTISVPFVYLCKKNSSFLDLYLYYFCTSRSLGLNRNWDCSNFNLKFDWLYV